MAETHSGGGQRGAIRFRISGPLGAAPASAIAADVRRRSARGAPRCSRSRSRTSRGRAGRRPSFARRPSSRAGSAPIAARSSSCTRTTPASTISPSARWTIRTAAAPTDQVGIESKLSWFDTLATLPGRSTDEDRTPEALATLTTRQHPIATPTAGRPSPGRPHDPAAPDASDRKRSHVDAGLLPREAEDGIVRVASRYAVAITPAMAELIDTRRYFRSDCAPVRA